MGSSGLVIAVVISLSSLPCSCSPAHSLGCALCNVHVGVVSLPPPLMSADSFIQATVTHSSRFASVRPALCEGTPSKVSHSTYIAMSVPASSPPRSYLPPRGCSPPFLPSLHHPDIHCYSFVLIGFTFTPVLPLIIVFTRLISGSFITVVQCKFSSIFTLFLLFTSCLFPLSVRLIHRTKYPLPPHLVTAPVILLSLLGVPRITPPSISTYYVHATIRRAAVLLLLTISITHSFELSFIFWFFHLACN